ncbi:LEA type 2 family protein [Marinospirillum alkaliphilum]|nr:LEA type 2 family protein [Marinospirillum alkaliphilum]
MRGMVGLLVVVSLLAGCSLLRDSGAWQDPEARVLDSKLVGLTLEKAFLEVELEVKNPNLYAIRLGALDYQLDLLDAKVLSGQQQQGNRLAAGKTQRLVLPLELEFAELGQFVSNLSQMKSLDYAVAGGMSFDVPAAGPLRIPFQVRGEIPVPQLPRFSLIGIEQKRLSLSGADLLLSLEFDNPNMFDLLVNRLSYSLALNGQPVTRGALPRELSIGADGRSRIDVPVNIAFGRSTLALYESLQRGGNLNYQLDLDTQLGSSLPVFRSFPFATQQTGQVQLSR